MIHPPILREIQSTLVEIFFDDRYADRAIEYRLKNQKKWGARDRKQFAELVYDAVRWWRKAWVILGQNPSAEATDLNALIELIADRKIGDEWIKGLSDAENLSIPDWLHEAGLDSFGADWRQVMTALNQKAPQDLRVNLFLTTLDDVQADLQRENIATQKIPDVPTGLSLVERKNIFQSPLFKKGFFEMQDRSSQRVAATLDPQPGERVLDACAGAGGKTLHLAALMKNKGRIVACDIHDWRLAELRRRSTRARADLIEIKKLPDARWTTRNAEKFDRVLLDVPCTGLGVLRRNPDTKWKLNPENFSEILKTQAEILDEFSALVKPAGVLVYSTCSLLPFENQNQIKNFLERTKIKFEIVEEKILRPDLTHGDGFYIAKLIRTGT